MENGTESRPVTRSRIDMQLLSGMNGLWGIKQILHELTTQVHIHFFEGAFAVHETFEVFIYMLPLDVFPVCQFLEVGEEITFHFSLVKEAVVLVEDSFITPVTQYFRLFHHACIEITLLLVGRSGEDVNPEGFTSNHLHGGIVTIAGIIVQT